MRTVFDNDMVAHLWANQSQSHARNGSGSFYFDGETIFSYGSHFPIARIVQGRSGTAVLYNPARYSPTTAGHQARVRRAVSHLTMFVVPHLGDRWGGGKVAHADNLKFLRQELGTALAKVTTARKNKCWAIRFAEECASAGNAYAGFFGLKTRFTLPNLDAERDKAAEYERREAERQAERQHQAELRRQQEREQAKETVEKWKAGENVRFPCWLFDEVYLRVKGDVIETSKGATVPLTHAIRLLPLIRSGRTYGHNGHSIHIGHFRVDEIDAQGNLRVGCHSIRNAEILRLAAELGL